MKTKLIVAAFLLAGLSAPAAIVQAQPQAQAQAPAKAEPAKRQCFWNRDVNSFSAQGEDAVTVRVGVRDYYRLDLVGTCPDVDWNVQIALVSRGGGYICAGADAEIISQSPSGTHRCMVRSVRKLSDAEVATLKSSKR